MRGMMKRPFREFTEQMAAKDDAPDREARLKAALRDNLKRRKQAARRTREEDDGEPAGKDKKSRA